MLGIEEQIREIESQSDESQNHLNSIVMRHNVSDKSMFIHKSLSGDIDLNVMKRLTVKTLHFVEPGKITRFSNMPDDLREFACGKQMLRAVPTFHSNGEQIEVLNLENNYITEIDLKPFVHLRILNVKSNRIQSLKNIPASIEQLYLDNNRIRSLNLANLVKLRVLHCNHNSMVRIENVPSSIVDFSADQGNPRVKIDYAFVLTSPSASASASATSASRAKPLPEIEAEYYDNLNEYFRLKSKYENELREDRDTVGKLAMKRQMSKPQVRARVAAVKGKCVNCRRRVGTVFKQRDLRYLAYCGDAVEPCNLKIELYRGDYMNRNEMIEYYYEEMAKSKEAIICKKMDTLFEYISESKSAAEFKKLVVDYRSMNEMFQEHLAEHNEVYFSDTRKELARLKQMKLYELERSMEELLETYKTTHSPHVLKELVDAIAKEYVPETEQLRKIRYNTMEIEEPIDGKYAGIVKLVQNQMDFSKMDYLMGEAPRVLQGVSKRD